MENFDEETIKSFGREWQRFDQENIPAKEISKIYNDYFSIVPSDYFNERLVCADFGSGTGRWAKVLCDLVGHIHLIEPSEAINVSKSKLKSKKNVHFHQKRIDEVKSFSNQFDFVYSLGVVHHIPDTKIAISNIIDTLKNGGRCLFYIYYKLDNRPFWYRFLWKLTNIARYIISQCPSLIKNVTCDFIAVTIYYPLAVLSRALDSLGINTSKIPLSYYKDKSWGTLRTDARDRFGTPLEKRFTKSEIAKILTDNGISNLTFSNSAPYWVVTGIKK